MAANAAKVGGTRPYDVVVFGATGFTGKLVCEHLARDYRGKVRWAMAGRNKAKLEEVKQELAKIDPAVQDVPLVVANADDADSLHKLAAATQVIIATAGPFAKYGSKVVQAAVDEGTHYCDITGELLWVKRMIAAHHQQAQEKGVKIVHCCGYDSVPFDMGVLLLADHARRQLGKGLSQAYGLSVDARGGFSGGTLASGFNQAEAEDPSQVAALMSDKYYLWPDSEQKGSDQPPPLLPEWNPVANKWMAPFVMEPINSRIVQRSSLLNGKYGSDFKYREGMGVSSLLGASAMSAFMVGVGAIFAFSPLRNLAKKKLPQPGEGPSRDVMMNGYWKHTMIGLTEEEEGKAPQVIQAYCADEQRDPGYWGTARLLLEAGLCLALDTAACDAAGCHKGGVLTPASAMGLVLLERLRRVPGVKFDIVESPAAAAGAGQGKATAAGQQEAAVAVSADSR